MIIMKNNSKFYCNPVLKGFRPDPSVIRVGQDYYLVNSSFQYFPAIPIYHSKDLVNWKQIGFGIERDDFLDLKSVDDSRGVWAPDISYKNGWYYIFFPFVIGHGDNLISEIWVIKSPYPEGPYSEPISLGYKGIDPSHFVDSNGSSYLVYNPGVRIAKLNESLDGIIEEERILWSGTGRSHPEGPHVFKRGDYYYTLLSEGGTFYDHCITVARSKKLFGHYQPCPYNPILIQKDEKSEFQRPGHGKPVITQDSDWWILYLGSRLNEGRFSTLGRETFLDPIKWTKDNWPIINEGKGPSKKNYYPDLKVNETFEPLFDDFNDEKLRFNWITPRHSKSYDIKNSHLIINLDINDLDTKSAANAILRREISHFYEAKAKLKYTPKNSNEEAGICCYYGIDDYISIGLRKTKCCYSLIVTTKINGNKNIIAKRMIKKIDGYIYFKVKVIRQKRILFYSLNGEKWIELSVINQSKFLSDEGCKNGGFTGTMIGFYGWNKCINKKSQLFIDWFDYKILYDKEVVK